MARLEFKLIFLLLCCSFLAVNALKKDAKIIIIGAGLSGVSAASRLVENGYTNVRILEAGIRMGGRVVSVPFGENVVDIGGQWIHGAPGNVIYDLVDGHNMLDLTPDHYFSGDLLSSEREIKPDYADVLQICNYVFRVRPGCENYWARPYGEFLTEGLDEEFNKTENFHISPENREDLVRQFAHLITLHFASDSWNRVSTSFCRELFEHPGHWVFNNWKDTGFAVIFDFITRKRPDPSKNLNIESIMELRKEVSQIDYTNADNGVVTVHCTDGHVYEAEHVLVTVSLGVLKANHKTLFNPPLPPIKVNSIDHLDHGILDKIIMEFARPFWPENWGGFSLVWTEQGLREIAGTRYEWTRGIMGVYQVSYQPNVLMGWITGDDARHMESLTNDEVLEDMMFVFERFLGGRYHYTAPISMIVTRWDSHPHFRGTMSSRSVMTDLNNASAFDLSLPVNNSMGVPVVLFAGEATDPLHYSLTHAAVGSGYREADRLMSL